MRRLLAVLCLAQLVTVLDNTVLNLALPALSADLGTGASGLQWIVGIYSLVQAGCLLAAGAAADRWGRRRLLLLGLGIFGAASLQAALATSTAQLVTARAVMGVGGALIGTATLAIALQVFEGAARTRAIGLWAAVSALGFALGPPVGGLVLAHASWQVLFLLNLPIVAVAVWGVRADAPESCSPGGPPDLLGAALSTAGLAAVAGAVIGSPDRSPLPLLLLGIALLAAFVGHERRTPYPMLDLTMLRDRQLSGALAGIVLITFGSTGVLFLLSLQLQLDRGLTPLEAGLRLAPFALTIVAVTATGLPRRVPRGVAIVLGMAALAAGFVLVGYGVLVPGLVLGGIGCGVANPALIDAVTSALPQERAGTGAGLDGVTAELGALFGVAALGAVVHAGHGMRTGQLLGAAAVFAGGLLAAALLRRAAATVAVR